MLRRVLFLAAGGYLAIFIVVLACIQIEALHGRAEPIDIADIARTTFAPEIHVSQLRASSAAFARRPGPQTTRQYAFALLAVRNHDRLLQLTRDRNTPFQSGLERHLIEAEALMRLGDLDGAHAILIEAGALLRPPTQARLKLAEVVYRQSMDKADEARALSDLFLHDHGALSADAWLLRTQIALDEGDHLAAASALARAAEIGARPASAIVYREIISAVGGAALRDQMQAIAIRAPDSFQEEAARLGRGYRALARGQGPEAARYFDESEWIIAALPRGPLLHVLAKWQAGDLSQAQIRLEDYRAGAPGDWLVHDLAFAIAHARHDRLEMDAARRQLMALNPKRAHLLGAIVGLEEALNGEGLNEKALEGPDDAVLEASIEASLEASLSALLAATRARGDARSASDVLQGHAEPSQHYAKLVRAAGRATHSRGEAQRFILQDLIRSGDPIAQGVAATMAEEAGMLSLAATGFGAAHTALPGAFVFVTGAARVADRAGDHKAGDALIRRFRDAYPGHLQARLVLARRLMGHGAVEEALGLLRADREAVEQDPDGVLLLSEGLVQTGTAPGEDIAAFRERVLRSDHSLAVKGDMLARFDQKKDAALYYRQALVNDGHNLALRDRYTDTMRALGRAREAAAFLAALDQIGLKTGEDTINASQNNSL